MTGMSNAHNLKSKKAVKNAVNYSRLIDYQRVIAVWLLAQR